MAVVVAVSTARPWARSAVALAISLAFCSGGCGHAPRAAAKVSASPAPLPAAKSREVGASAPVRHVGDFFVHRFSGSFAAEPLTLTEEVKAEEASAWVVDFSLSQNDQVEKLRVRFDRRSGKPIAAARVDGKAETPAQLADYDALMARTVYAADVNDGLVSENAQTCLVGADALDCETKTYKVWVGEAAATLSVVHSATYADRDVSGEITTEDGKLVYRAELVEARQGKPATGFASR